MHARACLVLTTLLFGTQALAATVEGEVTLPSSAPIEDPSDAIGFVPPIKNPIAPVKPIDHRPTCFVWLDGGPRGADATSVPANPVLWRLSSHSFDQPTLPVVAGSSVTITNMGREAHQLTAPDAPDLIPKAVIGPGSSSQAFKVPASPVRITSPALPHLTGLIVPVATRYFSRIGRDGKYRIEDVPAGRWGIKVWCRDAWVGIDSAVDVGNRGTAKAPRIELPAKLGTAAAATP